MRDRDVILDGDKLGTELVTMIATFMKQGPQDDASREKRWEASQIALAKALATMYAATYAATNISDEDRMLFLVNWIRMVFDLSRAIRSRRPKPSGRKPPKDAH